MESELEPCPVCGAKILPSVVPMYDDGSAASTASCFNGKCLYRVRREDHNTLARRAEIGALVERIVDGLGYVQMECEADANGEAGMYDVRSHDASAYTDTLLDALRSLAKECQLPEKP